MEKRLSKNAIKVSIIFFGMLTIFLLMVVFLLFAQTGFFKKTFPQLAPFIPDFSPFNVSITILPTNHYPVIGWINSSIFVCEDAVLAYLFNVTEIDVGNPLSVYIDPGQPSVPFNIRTMGSNHPIYYFRLDAIPNKTHAKDGLDDWKVFEETIIAYDGRGGGDFRKINITVIGINHPPEINPGVIPAIGVQTVWAKGDNSSFYMEVNVTDVEDINQDSPRINFNITILNSSGSQINMFDITSEGVMNFTANKSLLLQNDMPHIYDVTVCAIDSELDDPYENIFLCEEETDQSLYVCEAFTLTVTNLNRPPNITEHNPNNNVTIFATGTQTLYFNITEYDPDGTIPDAYWYVDGEQKEFDNGSLTDDFTYSFGCGKKGQGIINATITDGELYDSVSWTINYSNVACPVPEPGDGSSPGGPIIEVCHEQWSCGGWMICENAKTQLEIGGLSGEDYRTVRDGCDLKRFDDKTCGFQKKFCTDVNHCNTTFNMPVDFQYCHYTENPNCADGIKNCHDGSCEFLIDCGGPCGPCPTCSDGIQNQNEQGIDCGGSCPFECEIATPLLKRPLTIFLLTSISLLFIIILIKFRTVLGYLRKSSSKERQST